MANSKADPAGSDSHYLRRARQNSSSLDDLTVSKLGGGQHHPVRAAAGILSKASSLEDNSSSPANNNPEDFGELFSAFGISPETGRRKKSQYSGSTNSNQRFQQHQRNSSVTLKDQIPKISNMDSPGGGRGQGEPRRFSVHRKFKPQQQQQQQLIPNGLHPAVGGPQQQQQLTFSITQTSLGLPQPLNTASIAASLPRLNFGNTKYTSLYTTNPTTNNSYSTSRQSKGSHSNGSLGGSHSNLSFATFTKSGISSSSSMAPQKKASSSSTATTVGPGGRGYFRSLPDAAGRKNSHHYQSNGFVPQQMAGGVLQKAEVKKSNGRTDWAAKYLK